MCCTSVAEFAEVCQKEITKFEADIELDTFDGPEMLLESSKCGLSEDISSTCINLPYTFPMDSAVVVSSDDLSIYGSVIIRSPSTTKRN
jgi:hypothetical protein